jgi:hypothetical protein
VQPGSGSQTPWLRVNLQHQGHETVVNRQDTPFTFNHDPVAGLFVFDATATNTDGMIEQEISLTLSQQSPVWNGIPFSGVGPFASWLLVIDPAENPGLDLSAVTSLELEFFGCSQSRVDLSPE